MKETKIANGHKSFTSKGFEWPLEFLPKQKHENINTTSKSTIRKNTKG